jgi:hypothetical protein
VKFTNPLLVTTGLGGNRDPYAEVLITQGTNAVAGSLLIGGPFPVGFPGGGARSVRLYVTAKRTDLGVGSFNIPVTFAWTDYVPPGLDAASTSPPGAPQPNLFAWTQQTQYSCAFRAEPSAATGPILSVSPAVIDVPVEGNGILVYLNPYIVGGGTIAYSYALYASNRVVPQLTIRQTLPGGDVNSTQDNDGTWRYSATILAGATASVPMPVMSGLCSASFDCINGAGAGNNGYVFIAAETSLNAPIGPMGFSATPSVHFPWHVEQLRLPPQPCALQVRAPSAATITANGFVTFGPAS